MSIGAERNFHYMAQANLLGSVTVWLRFRFLMTRRDAAGKDMFPGAGFGCVGIRDGLRETFL